ncbi:MAG: serine acetyltransferase [Bacteroidota bacterium]|nr:serine acetyltransferase [Bacteroidota bacterium]
MNKTVKSDLYRHEGLTGLKGFIKGWFIPGFRYIYVFRKVTWKRRFSPAGIFFRLLKRRYRYKYGFEISPDAKIGDGLYLTSHCGPVIIGPVTIGKYCNISHSVTIGRSYRDGVLGRPTLGDYVWIGPGAVLVGKITIGNNVLIAPNSFVNFDVPDKSLVIGNPGKIISRENPTRNYINDILNE